MSIKETILPLADALAEAKVGAALSANMFGRNTEQTRSREFECHRAFDTLCDALDAADREVERLSELAVATHIVMAERELMKAENAALRLDAERYRWLKEMEKVFCWNVPYHQPFTTIRGSGDTNVAGHFNGDLDAAIDAARAALGDGK